MARKIERPVGRPTKLTPKVIEQVEAILGQAYTQSAAATFARVDYSTYCAWKNRGAEEREQGRNTLYVKFLNAVERGLEEGCLALEQVVVEDARKNPKAAAGILGHRKPDDWAAKPAGPLVAVSGPYIRVIAPGAPPEEE